MNDSNWECGGRLNSAEQLLILAFDANVFLLKIFQFTFKLDLFYVEPLDVVGDKLIMDSGWLVLDSQLTHQHSHLYELLFYHFLAFSRQVKGVIKRLKILVIVFEMFLQMMNFCFVHFDLLLFLDQILLIGLLELVFPNWDKYCFISLRIFANVKFVLPHAFVHAIVMMRRHSVFCY